MGLGKIQKIVSLCSFLAVCMMRNLVQCRSLIVSYAITNHWLDCVRQIEQVRFALVPPKKKYAHYSVGLQVHKLKQKSLAIKGSVGICFAT